MSLRSVLLVLLSREPNTGYGVSRLLHHEAHHLWEARLQQIYGEFAKLQKEGLVQAREISMLNRPAKKVYSLTPAGEQALNDWLAKPPSCHAVKDELLIQLSCLDRIPNAVAVRRLEQRRDEALSDAAALRELIVRTPRTSPAYLGSLITLEAARARSEAEVSWCEKALAVLRERTDEPQPVPSQPQELLRVARR